MCELRTDNLAFHVATRQRPAGEVLTDFPAITKYLMDHTRFRKHGEARDLWVYATATLPGTLGNGGIGKVDCGNGGFCRNCGPGNAQKKKPCMFRSIFDANGIRNRGVVKNSFIAFNIDTLEVAVWVYAFRQPEPEEAEEECEDDEEDPAKKQKRPAKRKMRKAEGSGAMRNVAELL